MNKVINPERNLTREAGVYGGAAPEKPFGWSRVGAPMLDCKGEGIGKKMSCFSYRLNNYQLFIIPLYLSGALMSPICERGKEVD